MEKLVLVLFFCLNSFALMAKDIDIQFIHTNDIHSYFLPLNTNDNLGGVARIKAKKEKLEKRFKISYFVDGGDFSEGSYGFLADKGSYSYQLMAKMNYDVVELGNHDWLYGLDFIEEKLTNLKNSQDSLPLLCGNISYRYQDKSKKNLLDRIKILDKGGVKIAFIGLATDEIYYQPYLEPHKMLDPISSAKLIVGRVKEKYKPDLIVAVTHLGVIKDSVLAEEVPDINLIVGGHSHTLLLEPQYVLNKISKKMIPIVQVGEYGQYLGETVLTFNDKLKTVRLKKYTVYPVSPDIISDPKIEELAQKAYAESFNYLSPKLTKSHVLEEHSADVPVHEINGKVDGNLTLTKPVKKVAYGPSNFGNLVVDAFQYVLKADFAFYDTNTMGLSLPHNKSLQIADLYNALPFIYNFEKKRAWNVYLLKMTVGQLRMLLMAGIMFSDNIAVSGKTLTYNPNGIILPTVNLKTYDGKELADEWPITVATTEAFLMALNLSKKYVGDMDIKVYDTGYEAWDLLGFYLQNRSETALLEANKVRHRLIQKNKDVIPLVCDIKQDLAALKEKKIRFTLPIENISRKKINKGFKVKVYQAPNIGYQSKVDSYSSYKLVYDNTIGIDLKDRSKINLQIELLQQPKEEIELSNYSYLPSRKYYVEIVTTDEVAEKNLLNNFQEFELQEYLD